MSDAMQYAFRALAQRALSEHELRARLARRAVDSEEAERVITRLRELGYLDDASLARAVAEKRGVGKNRVQFELKRRGVERGAAEAALAERDPERERRDLTELVERHRERWQRARDPRARAFGFLARRGYPPGLIWEALEELAVGPDLGENQA